MFRNQKQLLAGIITLIFNVITTSLYLETTAKRYIGMIILGGLTVILLSRVLSKVSDTILAQISVIAAFIFAYTLSSLLFNNENIPETLKTYIEFYLINEISSFLVLYSVFKKNYSLKNVKEVIRSNIWIILTLAVVILMRIGFMDLIPRWDSGEYYYRFMNAVEEFHYSAADYWNLFKICGHPTFGMAFIYSIGEFIFLGQIIGIMLVNLIVTVIAVFCVYKLFLKIIKDISKSRAALYAAVISVLPLFNGTFGYFNVDYVLAVFTIFVLYSLLYKKYILFAVSCLLCIQTKETGLIVIAGILAGTCLLHLGKNRTSFIKCIFKDPVVYITSIVIVIQLCYMKAIGGISEWTQHGEPMNFFRWDNYGENCFGINLKYIILKQKQHFLLNFNWIFTCVILAGLVYTIYRLKKLKRVHFPKEIIPLGMVWSAYIIFSHIYITSPLVRYNSLSDILWCFFALCIFHSFPGRLWKKFFVVCMCVALTVQSYLTIDPVTKMLFRNKPTGAAEMVYPYEYVANKYIDVSYLADNIVYNNQYTFLDKGLDYILGQAGYHTNMNIITFRWEIGLRVSGNPYVYALEWDPYKKKRVVGQKENTIPIKVLYDYDYEYGETILEKEAVFITTPLYGVDERSALRFLSSYYTIGERGEYKSIQGNMAYYKLYLKERFYR